MYIFIIIIIMIFLIKMKNCLGLANTISKIKSLFYFSTKVKSSNSLPAKYLS
jgi:hypothetical protein